MEEKQGLDEKKIHELMYKLTDELQEIIKSTEAYKGYKRPFKGKFMEPFREMAEVGEDAEVVKSKEEAARSYRAASALMEIYTALGPIELALAVAEIRSSQKEDNTQPPTFTPKAAKILSRYYKKTEFALEKSTEEEKASPAMTSGIQPEEKAPSKTDAIATKRAGRWIKKALPGVVLVGIPIGGHLYQEHKHTKEKTELRAAQTESIDLRVVSDLTPEQKRKLLELQEIAIPELKDKVKESEPSGWLLAAGVLGGLLLLPSAFSSSLQTQKTGRNGKVLSVVDGVIEEACDRASPHLDLSELPRRSELTR